METDVVQDRFSSFEQSCVSLIVALEGRVRSGFYVKIGVPLQVPPRVQDGSYWLWGPN